MSGFHLCYPPRFKLNMLIRFLLKSTLPETKIFAPQNGWLVQMKFPIGARPIFRGYVSFTEGKDLAKKARRACVNFLLFSSHWSRLKFCQRGSQFEPSANF